MINLKKFVVRNFKNGHHLTIALSYLISIISGLISMIWLDFNDSSFVLLNAFFYSMFILEFICPKYYDKAKKEYDN